MTEESYKNHFEINYVDWSNHRKQHKYKTFKNELYLSTLKNI